MSLNEIAKARAHFRDGIQQPVFVTAALNRNLKTSFHLVWWPVHCCSRRVYKETQNVCFSNYTRCRSTLSTLLHRLGILAFHPCNCECNPQFFSLYIVDLITPLTLVQFVKGLSLKNIICWLRSNFAVQFSRIDCHWADNWPRNLRNVRSEDLKFRTDLWESR